MKTNLKLFSVTLAIMSVLFIQNASAEPALNYDYSDVQLFSYCQYYKITDFSSIGSFTEDTLRTESKVEIVGSVKNGYWEYEYIEPYIMSMPDKLIPYDVTMCTHDNITAKMSCKDVTHHNQTYKDVTFYRSVWLTPKSLVNDNSKLSYILMKPTQNVRFCTEIERVWTPDGFTTLVDIIPYFNGVTYFQYEFINTSMTRWPLIQVNNDSNPFIVNDTAGLDIGGGIQYIWCNATATFIYNDTSRVICANDTAQIGTFIDEGNGTNFGLTEENLVLWIHMNDAGATDESRYSFTTTVISAPVIVDGQIGKSLSFDGNNDRIEVDPAGTIYDDGCMMTWIFLDAWIEFDGVAGEGNALLNELRFMTWASGTTADFTIDTKKLPTGLPTLNSWQHVAMCWNVSSDFIKVYYNGSLEIQDLSPGLIDAPSLTSLWIGGYGAAATNRHFNGKLDDFRIYNRTLSLNEISSIYNNTQGTHNYSFVGIMETFISPPPPPIPIHSFIIYKLMGVQIPFISEFLESLAWKAVILFMDRLTVEGNVDIGGNVNVSGNISGNDFYGEMWFHNDLDNVTTTITTQGVYVNVGGFDTGEQTGQTLNGFSYFTDTLVAQVAGKYKVDYSLSFGNVGNNQEYQMNIAVGGVEENNTDAHRKIGAAGDVGNSGATGFIDLSVGDQVNLQIRNNDGTGDVVSHAANVNLIRIGDIS